MRAVASILLILAASCACSQAFRAEEFLAATQQGADHFTDVLQSIAGAGLSKSPEKDADALALIKYVVVPSKAKDFIEVVRAAKKDAEKFDGYIKYSLVKTADDNISYWAFGAWESFSDLKNYLESDEAKKLEKYLVKEDIPAFITPLLPPLV